jgi:hypothetical protein
MIIIGCDYHPSFEQIAFVDTETGELQERRLEHREEAEKFYRDLAAQGMKVRVGMEASGHARWFERLHAELQCELWIGDAAAIHAKRMRTEIQLSCLPPKYDPRVTSLSFCSSGARTRTSGTPVD